MKRPAIFLLSAVLFWAGCGGGSSSEPAPPPTSGFTKRAFVANELDSRVYILNGENDTVSEISIGFTSPSMIAVSPGQFALVYNSSGLQVAVIDLATEAETQRYQLSAPTEVMVPAAQGRKVYIPLRDAAVGGAEAGTLAILNINNQTTTQINIPRVRRAVASPNGSKVLAFSDSSNSVSVVNTSDNTMVSVPGFDRPVHAVFENENRALVLSCGPECGGTTAMVHALDLTTNTITGSVVVSAATVGLLDSGSLYVAGSSAAGGRLDVVNAGTLAVTRSGVAISEGFHHEMVLHQGKLFIAAKNPAFGGTSACLDVAADRSCLTIYDVASNTAVVPSAVDQFGNNKGPVTGLTAITGRNVVYAAEGGELRIYDTTTSAEHSSQISFVGRITDAVLVDP